MTLRKDCTHPQYAVQDTRTADRVHGDMKFDSFCTLCGANGYFAMTTGHVWTKAPGAVTADARANHRLKLEVI